MTYQSAIVFIVKYLKQKLEEHCADHLFFAQQPGRSNIICFKDYIWFVMNEFKKAKSQNPIDLIIAAAKMIKNDLRVMPFDKTTYPDINKRADIEYAESWVPDSLATFLSHLVSQPLKRATIGQ